MVFYENCGLQNLYDMVRYCQVASKLACLCMDLFQLFTSMLASCRVPITHDEQGHYFNGDQTSSFV